MYFSKIISDLNYQQLLIQAAEQVRDKVSISDSHEKELVEYLRMRNIMGNFFQAQLKNMR